MRHRTKSIALAIALMLVAPAAARAEGAPNDPQSAAQELYTAGRESFRAGLYGRALEDFERSLALVPSPNTRLYLARALRELGRWNEAAEQYRSTAREAEARGGKYTATRDAAEVELRDVQVRLDRGEPGAKQAAVAAVAPPPVEKASQGEPVRTMPVASVPSSSGPTTMTWVSGGVAVAGVASFAVLYALAGERYGYLEDNCTRVRDAACDSARSTGKSEEIVAYVSLGVAAAAAAVAVISLVTRPRSNAAAGAARVMGPWRLTF
jgi:tetratricopeptide (TPR) repeat protein